MSDQAKIALAMMHNPELYAQHIAADWELTEAAQEVLAALLALAED